MRFRSIRFNISALYTAVLGVILVIFAAALYSNLSYVLFQGIDQVMEREDILRLLEHRLKYVLLMIVVILVSAGFIGRKIVSQTFKPVAEISETIRKITHEDLSRRVNIGLADEEIRGLVGAVNDMIARLEKSFAHIREFSSNVSHELKTPLAIIKGESELALKTERSTQEYQKTIRENLDEVERMIKTIEDMLLLARLEYQEGLLNTERISLNEFLKEIHGQSKILASGRKIDVQLDCPQQEFCVDGDKVQLRRLFFNLISNAIKFNREGGWVRIRCRQEGREVKISVSDSGMGISSEDRERIFDRFFRCTSGHEEMPPGSGLGLSISQSIAGLHQGRITVDSHPEKGSTFTIILPAA